jgi:glycosyltransferase involved in cell wall biosynthesis
VGRIDEFYKKVQKHVEDSVVDKNIQKDIIFTGDVDDKNLDGIYRGAKVFAFPSLYEGFGLPPLEACSRGIPVVAAKSSSLPEVLTDCAHYCNPKDIEDIARAIDYVGGTHKVQDYLSARGRERAKHFSWQKLAKDTVDVYSRIMV